jgi:hypothetical protein
MFGIPALSACILVLKKTHNVHCLSLVKENLVSLYVSKREPRVCAWREPQNRKRIVILLSSPTFSSVSKNETSLYSGSDLVIPF